MKDASIANEEEDDDLVEITEVKQGRAYVPPRQNRGANLITTVSRQNDSEEEIEEEESSEDEEDVEVEEIKNPARSQPNDENDLSSQSDYVSHQQLAIAKQQVLNKEK